MQPPLIAGILGINRSVGSPRTENLQDIPATLLRGSEVQKRLKPSCLRTFKEEKVHSCSVHGTLRRSLQKPSSNESINCSGDLLHVIPGKGSELFVR